MKKIVIYKFNNNGAEVSVSYGVPPKNKRFGDDVLWLEWKTEEGETEGMGMRPDEALLIAEMLVEAVRVTAVSYQTAKPIKNYRIKKRSL